MAGLGAVPFATPKIGIATHDRRLFLPALAQVVRKTGEKLLERQVERLTDTQQREYGNRTPGLDHLPVTDAETTGFGAR